MKLRKDAFDCTFRTFPPLKKKKTTVLGVSTLTEDNHVVGEVGKCWFHSAMCSVPRLAFGIQHTIPMESQNEIAAQTWDWQIQGRVQMSTRYLGSEWQNQERRTGAVGSLQGKSMWQQSKQAPTGHILSPRVQPLLTYGNETIPAQS